MINPTTLIFSSLYIFQISRFNLHIVKRPACCHTLQVRRQRERAGAEGVGSYKHLAVRFTVFKMADKFCARWPATTSRVCSLFSLAAASQDASYVRAGCHCQTTTMRTMAYNKSCPTHTHRHRRSSPADRAVCVWGAPFSCRNWRNKIEQFIDLRSIWCAIIAPNLPEIKKKEEKRTQQRKARKKRRNNKGRVCIGSERWSNGLTKRFPLGTWLLLFSF